MRLLLWNILLACIWAAMTGTFTLGDLLVGFVIGYAVLFTARSTLGRTMYFTRTWQVLELLGFFLYELVLANLKVARDVLRIRLNVQPGIVAIPLDVKTDAQITALANLITLTPGTFSLDVSTDRRMLYIHTINVGDAEALRQEIKTKFERRVMEVF